jgi:hypothetical protein
VRRWLEVFGLAAVVSTSACGELDMADAVTLMKRSGVQQLRRPLRPLRGGTRLILIGLDGVGADVLGAAIDGGELASLQELAGEGQDAPGLYAHGYRARDVLSILPSTTMAAWATVYTGAAAARSGVPGNEWFDRTRRTFVAPAPVSVRGMDHAVRIHTDGFLGGQVQVETLFERLDLRSHASLGPIHRGADVYTTPHALDAVRMFSILPESLQGEHGVSQEAYAELDRGSVEEVLEAIDTFGIPDLQTVYFPGVDLIAHAREEPLREQHEHLRRVIDPGLRALFARYRAEGVLEDTWIVVVSDHGHTPVSHDEQHAMSVDDEVDDPPAVLRRAGFRPRAPELVLPDDADFDAVLAYQGGLAYLYLADRSRCPAPGEPCDWSAPPRYEQDVLVAARAFLRASEEGEPFGALEGSLAAVLVREPVPTGVRPNPFRTFDGESTHDVASWLEAHPRESWVEVASRLRALAVGPHGHLAGDVLLLANLDPEAPEKDRTYFSAPYHSWHGSPSRRDSEIALFVTRVGAPGRRVRSLVEDALAPDRSQTRITPLVERLLDSE